VLGTMYVQHRLTKKESKTFHDILEETDPDRGKPSYFLLHYVLVPIIGILIWPLAVFMKIQELIKKPEEETSYQDPVFEVKLEHLVERLSLDEIERREIILDPMGAAPKLPFGHLNKTWLSFLEKLSSDSEIWSFSADWETAWGVHEKRSGYAIVRAGLVQDFFVTDYSRPREID
jgi:hypothetical protein